MEKLTPTNKCKGKGCRATCPPHKQTASGWRGGRCRKCRHRDAKHRDPMAYAYNFHKQNARSRGIPWSLSRDEFREFWEAHPDAWEQKRDRLLSSDTSKARMTNKDTLEMDRKDASKGYEADNIQIATKRVNVQRMWEDRRFKPDFVIICTYPVPASPEDDELPF